MRVAQWYVATLVALLACGAFGAPGRAASPRTACELLTAAQVSTAVSATVTAATGAKHSPSLCLFAGVERRVSIALFTPDLMHASGVSPETIYHAQVRGPARCPLERADCIVDATGTLWVQQGPNVVAVQVLSGPKAATPAPEMAASIVIRIIPRL